MEPDVRGSDGAVPNNSSMRSMGIDLVSGKNRYTKMKPSTVPEPKKKKGP